MNVGRVMFIALYVMVVICWVALQNVVSDIQNMNFIKLGSGTYICQLTDLE